METKSLRLQVLIEPNLFNELAAIGKEQKIPHRSDSELIRYCLKKFLYYETDVKLTIYAMKQQIDRMKGAETSLTNTNNALQQENNRLSGKIQTLEQQLKQLKDKNKELRDGSKTKPRKNK